MPRQNITPREQSVELLRQALATGIRGRNREAIESAIEILEDDGRGGLTDLHYKNCPVGKTLRDPDRPGLWFRNNKSGPVWLFNYTSPITGEVKAEEFGIYPAMSLVQAREKWAEFKTAVKAKRDPFIESDEAESKVTVKELCKLFIDDYAIGPDRKNPRKRTWREDQRMFDYDLIPEYGDRPVVSITDDDAEELLDAIIERGSPRSAEKLQTAARKMWNEAIKRNRKKGSKARENRWVSGLTHNPWAGVELEKRETNTVYLNESQIGSFMRKLPDSDMPEVIKDILALQFQTVARISEVTGITWDEVDIHHAVWNLPAERSKNKQAHRVLLSKQSLAILERREDESDSNYVFPSDRTSKPYPATLVARHLKNNREHLQAPNGFSTHGLRHTALTQVAMMGYGKHIRDRISNHKDTSIDSTYQHYEYDKEARECWQAWADQLDDFAEDKGEGHG